MRIALFVPSLRGGGAERVMLRLADGFAERGHTVNMVLARAAGPFLRDVPEAVRVVDLNAHRTLASLPGLVRYLRRERPDAMLSAMDHANVVALWARRLAGAPDRLVISVHTTLGHVRPRGVTAKLLPALVRLAYPSADAIVAVSHGVAVDVTGICGLDRRDIQVVYNPISIDDIVARARTPLPHPWFAAAEPPVILGAGRLVAEKDFETLIRAFALVRERCPVRLVILGEGEERGALEDLARSLHVADDVDLPGFVENPFNYMARAALFVLSSRREGLPTVLLEAMACGTPVVATDCPSGPSEILGDACLGALVPVGDAAVLAVAIWRALEEDGRTFDPEVPLSRFSAQSVTDRYLALLGTS